MRPVAQDLEYYWDYISAWMQKHGSPRVLLLGVTPELYSLPWPKGTDFLAVDNAQAMIDAMWPGPKEAVQCADWLCLNLPDSSRDIVLCDGGLHLLKYPQEQKGLVLLIRRILSDQGLCIFRLFALPTPQEPPEAVIKDLLNGRILNNSILKVRLAMSLQRNAEEGVELRRICSRILEAAPDLEKLAAKIGWTLEHTMTINNYKDLGSRFHFLTVEQSIDLFCRDPGGFQMSRLQVPSYELGQSCPTVAMQCCSRKQTSVSA